MKLTKRGGGAHNPTGLDSIPDGAFGLDCPACPHPGRNLPVDWEQAPDNTKSATSPPFPLIHADLHL